MSPQAVNSLHLLVLRAAFLFQQIDPQFTVIRCFRKIFAKSPTFDLNKRVFGKPVTISGGAISCNERNLKSKGKIAVKAAAEAGVMGLKNYEVNLDLGFDVVAERELREKGLLGDEEDKASVHYRASLLLSGGFGEIGNARDECG
ncbi:hypothetical protein OIU84_009020 [Salix udensis]|uniref:Uncharacterized protein n=1 Tax=Salix udensis TaxID=889485 RepID=A0AAD6JQQ1_9ROSI|nr:hypothetical protein OIU84_009020 [Salix udensis]